MELGCLPVSVAVPVVPTSKALVLATPITFALRDNPVASAPTAARYVEVVDR